MTWFYNDRIFTEQDIKDNIGFIYQITDTVNNKKYIGQKVFYNKVAKRPLKGMKNRRISKKQSDWQQYYGSNDLLKEIVDKTEDKSRFNRKIIKLCTSKAEMNYWETYYIFMTHSLLKEDYWNNWVSCRINRNQLTKVKIES